MTESIGGTMGNAQAHPFRLGYTSSSWGYTPDVDAVLNAIRTAGFEGVEFNRISASWLGTPSRARSFFERHGLVPVATLDEIGVTNEDRTKGIERLRRVIEYSAEVGHSIFCLVGPLRVGQRLPNDDEFKRLADETEALIDTAAPLGITVTYHAHPGCTVESEEEQDRLLEFTQRLKICLDVSVSGFMQENPVAQIRKYRDQIAYVHMKDWTKGKFCILGRGTIGLDFPAILATLTEIDYTGWVMTELSSSADTGAEASCLANGAYLRSLGY